MIDFVKMKDERMTVDHIEPFKWAKYDYIDGWIYIIKIPMSDKIKPIAASIAISGRELKRNGWKSIEDVSEEFLHIKFKTAFISMFDVLDTKGVSHGT